MSLKINPILPKQQSTVNKKVIIKPKVADKTKQTNQAINRLAVRFNGNDETKPPKKTADTFLKEVIAEQPIKINDKNTKKETIAMKADKSADKMTKEDYDMSFRRAVYSKAMLGIKLTDADIKLADQTLKDAEIYNSNYDLKASVESLREKQRESGRIIKVDVGTENLEKAKLAGQAVLRLRTHEAKEFDKNQAGVENETNQKFIDQGKVVYNSIVNTVEGTINTGIDLIRFNNGRNPLALVDPFRPRVDLSGIKADYRSEMMRTDVNGKLDGNALKRGDFTEGAVTILAPLVVGKVASPTTPVISVVPKGKLVIEAGRTLTFEESIIANKLAREGKIVEVPIEASNKGIQNVRTPDFIVDGVKTELKTISNLKGKDMSASLSRRILDGAGQGSNIIIDARNQIGMTEEIAKSSILRAYGAQRKLNNIRISEVRVIGSNFDITLRYKSGVK
jgi:Contact-dependent growth inhibition CdiA C-terminal domain